MMKIEACDCGAPHVWVTWNGYQLGPLARDAAEQAVSMFEGMKAELLAYAQNDMIGKMVLGAVQTLPTAEPCRDA